MTPDEPDGDLPHPLPQVPAWALVPALTAPVALVGGWTVAASRRPEAFDPAVETISALAALGATDRWIMTSALVGLGLCHLGTALALRPAAPAGRCVLALGGLATIGVAAAPLPAGGGSSAAHTGTAALAFGALAVWPALAWRRPGGADAGGPEGLRRGPWGLRRGPAVGAAAVLTGLVGWFAAELAADAGRVGLSERVAAGAQSLWPLAVVASVVLARRRGHDLRGR